MIEDCLEILRGHSNVTTRMGITADACHRLVEAAGAALPREYLSLLEQSNGVSVFWGYFRIFGTGCADDVDVMMWNDTQCWKFAWGEKCSGYWCFGETAWGDQYAFDLSSLQSSGQSGVYFLEALTMKAERLADSFQEFLEGEFLRNARQPYDSSIVPTFERMGPLAPDVNLVYNPSPLLGGEESLQNVSVLPARAAMITQGDIVTQIERAPDHVRLLGTEAYLDTVGRPRLRLLWGE